MRSHGAGIGRGAREVLLWCEAVLGTLCIVAGLAAVFLDVKPLVFRSGSMSPAIETGALGLARPVSAEQIEVGDIVSVVNAESVRVTHRVIEIDDDAADVLLHLQGDANAVPDPETYPVASADRVFTSVPYAGYVVSWVSGPVGIFAGGVLAGALLLVAFGPGSRRLLDRVPPGKVERGGADSTEPEPDAATGGADPAHPARRGQSARRAGAMAALLVLVLGGQGLGQSQETTANWTGRASASSGTFAAGAITAPENHDCSNEGGLLGLLGYAEVTWPNVGSQYGYRVEIVEAGNGAPAGDDLHIPPQSGATVSRDFRIGLLNIGLAGRNVDLRIFPYLPGTDWESASYRSVPVRTAQLLVGLSVRCGHP